MGLLICLVGRAVDRRRDRRGASGRPRARGSRRRRRRLVRGMDPHGRPDRGARPRGGAQGPPAHRGVVLHARQPLLPDRRALHPSALAAQHGRLRQVGEDLPGRRRRHPPSPHRAGRGALRRRRACRRCWCIPIRPPPDRSRRPAWCSSTASTSPRSCNTATACPTSPPRGIGCLIVDGPGNGESVRFRNLPLIAETERYAHGGLRVSRRPPRVRSQAHRRDGALARRLLRAARRRARAALRLLRRLGRAMGLSRHLGEAARRARFAARCWRCRCRRSICNGCSASTATRPRSKKLEGFRLDGIVQKMTCPFLLLHGAGDEQIPLSLAEKCFAAVGSKQKTLQGVPARGGRLPSLPGRQRHHRRALHVGLDRGRVEAGHMSADLHHRGRCRPAGHRQGRDRGAGGAVRDLGRADDEQHSAPPGAAAGRRLQPDGRGLRRQERDGLKAYAGMKGAQFHTLLYSSIDGKLKAMIEADLFGQLRTGAASGLATRLLANPDADTLGVIGAGRQSRTQAVAVCAVRPIKRVKVFARTRESTRGLCARAREGARHRGARRSPSAEACVADAGVVVTITKSAEPVCRGRVARQGRARQRRRRQFRRPPRGRRRHRAACRGQGDRPGRAGQGRGGRIPRAGGCRQARMVRRPRARRARHRQGQGPHVAVRPDAVQVARHRARGRRLRRARLPARARRRRRPPMPV